MISYSFTDEQQRLMKKMASEGQYFTTITLKVTGDINNYQSVRKFCNSHGYFSRLGIKKMSTQRLKELQKKNLSVISKQYAIKDIKACIDYIYNQNKDLEAKYRRMQIFVKLLENSKDPKRTVSRLSKFYK